MMRHTASMPALSDAHATPTDWKARHKVWLTTTLVVALPILSLLAGAAMAAHNYGLL